MILPEREAKIFTFSTDMVVGIKRGSGDLRE